ncbi:hypothetical protein P4152_11720 [Pseudomonas aeruginosa]|uniref:hypothetical protein n=1 Tax=Pseudomonas aeruginosa TaxID=287 RepID=UPI0013C3342D|nr:hypothetical protein [Pseudomonas aeruginosa]MBG4225993.1 hypothetical protein [Pseudomonas aeruginosa]MBG4236966.1 hypothetical protein [Pseudomonas aeruginosa]MDF5836484.1 hypothetical protein [Pseudomonas aeruginosa]MDF5902816.1 hypothetical protein [Pseudomonas aeruginosa]MDT0994101.1 hypothetical protein [Pseudomonas aeruginosa]
MAITEPRPLKVLTSALAVHLSRFNGAARELQALGVRLLQIQPTENCLVIQPEDGRRLQAQRMTEGFQRHPSAGSTRYTVQFRGVTLEWREPISYHDFATSIH